MPPPISAARRAARHICRSCGGGSGGGGSSSSSTRAPSFPLSRGGGERGGVRFWKGGPCVLASHAVLAPSLVCACVRSCVCVSCAPAVRRRRVGERVVVFCVSIPSLRAAGRRRLPLPVSTSWVVVFAALLYSDLSLEYRLTHVNSYTGIVFIYINDSVHYRYCKGYFSTITS